MAARPRVVGLSEFEDGKVLGWDRVHFGVVVEGGDGRGRDGGRIGCDKREKTLACVPKCVVCCAGGVGAYSGPARIRVYSNKV